MKKVKNLMFFGYLFRIFTVLGLTEVRVFKFARVATLLGSLSGVQDYKKVKFPAPIYLEHIIILTSNQVLDVLKVGKKNWFLLKSFQSLCLNKRKGKIIFNIFSSTLQPKKVKVDQYQRQNSNYSIVTFICSKCFIYTSFKISRFKIKSS